MHRDLCDLGSQILIRILPRERTLSEIFHALVHITLNPCYNDVVNIFLGANVKYILYIYIYIYIYINGFLNVPRTTLQSRQKLLKLLVDCFVDVTLSLRGTNIDRVLISKTLHFNALCSNVVTAENKIFRNTNVFILLSGSTRTITETCFNRKRT